MFQSRATRFRKQSKVANTLLEELAYSSTDEDEVLQPPTKKCQEKDSDVAICNDVWVSSHEGSDSCSSGNGSHDSSSSWSGGNSDVHSERLHEALTDSQQFSDASSISSSTSVMSIDELMDSTDESSLHESFTGNEGNETVSFKIRKALKTWYCQHNVTLTALGALLICLRPFVPYLPKDARSILHTETQTSGKNFEKMSDGEYYNFGLKHQVSRAIMKCLPTSSIVELNFNVDGLPLFKSTNLQYWPILCSLQHAVMDLPPFIVSIFCGTVKPELGEFFKDLVPELKDLLTSGLCVNGTQYSFKVRCFVCDAPARSYIKGTIGHGGYYGCDFCEVRGKWDCKITFPKFNAKLRTDESFASHSQRDHHRERSPLTDLGLKMISMFPMDYMHQILLGVVKRFVLGLFAGKAGRKLNIKDIKIIDTLLLQASKMWPSDFSRKPRTTEDIKRWKATELRQFLLYLGPGVLRSRMNKNFYILFLHIHVAITILCREDLLKKFATKAHTFLVKAAKLFKKLYGPSYIVYNVHMMIHLTEQAVRFGVLDKFSGFPFESYLNTLKRLTKSCKAPLQGLVQMLRFQEEVNCVSGKGSKKFPQDGPVASALHHKGLRGTTPGKLYRKFRWHGTTLSISKGDNFVFLKNKKVLEIHNFLSTNSGYFVIGKVFLNYANAYSKPCQSSSLGIYLAWELGGRPDMYSIDDVEWKAVLVPYKDKAGAFIAFPLRH